MAVWGKLRQPTFSSDIAVRSFLIVFCIVSLVDGAENTEEGMILSPEALNRHRQQYHRSWAGLNSNNRKMLATSDEDEAEAEDKEMNPTVAHIPPPAMVHMSSSRAQRERSLWSEDLEKKAAELCGTSASLECGKQILSLIEGQDTSELSLHMKCDLRDDFLECIDTQKENCLDLASKSVFPHLPPKEVIKMERSKLWRVLWTAGGCVLAD